MTKGLLIAIAMAVAPVYLYAVDGVVLINQATVNAAGGFPYVISQSGSYKLSGNLTVPDANTTAIIAAADNVAIDLNGFSIIGPVVCSGGPPVTSCSPTVAGAAAIGMSSLFNGTSISNGTIRGMGEFGIGLSGTGNRIVNVQAYSNASSGIVVTGRLSAIVTSSSSNNNGGDGFDVQGTVIGNIAIGNKGNGIQINARSTISDNVTTQNGGNGITGEGTILGNTSVANGGAGISVACPSLVTTNSAIENPSGNIVTNTSTCTVVNNSAP